ncbi:SGNH/GDSL hydrolase family protein, partial [candidate division KSB1 bacterium]
MRRKVVPIFFSLILILPGFLYSQVHTQQCLFSKSFKIVILGSSTAVGKGASNPDSSWVGRYRNHLLLINNFNKVINLAVNGYTTYELMPDGHTPPASRPLPDTAHNISAAISLDPDAIIINLPSNDIAKGYSILEQLINFDTILNYAHRVGVQVWVCTPQPRYMISSQIRKQKLVMEAFFSRYREYTIDFWEEISATSGHIKDIYNYGDGTHLNDTGHAILFNRVLEKNIPTTLFQPSSFTDYSCYTYNPSIINNYSDSILSIDIIVTNLGLPDPNYFTLSFKVFDLTSNQFIQKSNIQLEGLKTCESDTIRYKVIAKPDHQYLFNAFTTSNKDINKENDSLIMKYLMIGKTGIPIEKNIQNNLILKTYSNPYDSVIWPDPLTNGFIIGPNKIFTTSNNNKNIIDKGIIL